MGTKLSQDGASAEGAIDTHLSDAGQTLKAYLVPDEVARRAMVKLNRALGRQPNRELREGIKLLEGIFGDL